MCAGEPAAARIDPRPRQLVAIARLVVELEDAGLRGVTVTEATHLLSRAPRGIETCLDFFLQGGAVLVPSSRAALDRCRQLVTKYADLPMDYADATLVALAEELETALVFTTDRTDFEIYRWRGRNAFKVVP